MRPLTAAAVMIATIAASRPDQAEHPKPRHKAHAARQRRLRRIEPYRGWTLYGGHSMYAIPAQIVECESHGATHESTHPYSSSGLYQIELSTWAAFGGRAFAAFPYLASKLQQSIVARRIWRAQGAAAWTCAWIVGWL